VWKFAILQGSSIALPNCVTSDNIFEREMGGNEAVAWERLSHLAIDLRNSCVCLCERHIGH
jgi:hypothetical protein